MLTQRLANCVFTIVVIVACIIFAVIAQRFEASGLLASSGLPSKFFPQLSLAITAVCALIVFLLYAFRGAAGDDGQELVFADAAHARRGLLMLVLSVVCYLIWLYLGFIPMAVVLGPVSLLVMGVRAPRLYLIVVALTVLIYLVFTRLLNIQLG